MILTGEEESSKEWRQLLETSKAEVPLSEMFGYATDLRLMTQGRATYTMEFEKYAEIPSNIAEELIEKAS